MDLEEIIVFCVDTSVTSALHFGLQVCALQNLLEKEVATKPHVLATIVTIGKDLEVLNVFTRDVDKLLGKVYNLKLKGNLMFLSGLQVAYMVLDDYFRIDVQKHIICFVGSAVTCEHQALMKLAEHFYVADVIVDVIRYGDYYGSDDLLKEFVDCINGFGTSKQCFSRFVPVSLNEDMNEPISISFNPGNQNIDDDVVADDEEQKHELIRRALEEERCRQELDMICQDIPPFDKEQDKFSCFSPERETSSANLESPESPDQNVSDYEIGDDTDNNTQESTDDITEEGTSDNNEADNENITEDTNDDDSDDSNDILPNFHKMSEEEQLNYVVQMSLVDAAEETMKQFEDVLDPEQGISHCGNKLFYNKFLANALTNLPGFPLEARDIEMTFKILSKKRQKERNKNLAVDNSAITKSPNHL